MKVRPTVTDKPIRTPYRRNIGQISADSAAAEPEAEQLYTPAPASPIRPITMQIAAVLNGFTVQISFDGSMGQLPGAIERLKALGATPTLGTPAAPIAAADDLPEGWKLCQKHHAPMRPRSKQGDVWHSHNVGTSDKPVYCKGYRGADSPGYEVE